MSMLSDIDPASSFTYSIHNESEFCDKFSKSLRRVCSFLKDKPESTGASDRGFYPIFSKRFDPLETLLTIHRPKKFCQLGHCAGLQCSVPNLNTPKGPSSYPKSIMLQFQLCYLSHLNVSQNTKTNINFRGQACVRSPAKRWVKDFILPHKYHAPNFY